MIIQSLVLRLPWFELPNATINQRKITIKEIMILQSKSRKVPTEEDFNYLCTSIIYGRKEEMLVFAVLTSHLHTSQELGIQLPKKHVEFFDVFDKVKANRLPEHRTYDCLIYLKLRTEPP